MNLPARPFSLRRTANSTLQKTITSLTTLIKRGVLLLLLLSGNLPLQAQTWQSDLVQVAPDGKITYHKDRDGFVLADFSHAGYGGGGVAIPNVKTVMQIDPVPGDNTTHIQAAIDRLAAMPADANGFRGALLLTKGIYEVYGTIRLHGEGMVLRGEGYGDNPGNSTILLAKGDTPRHRTVLVVGRDEGYALNRGMTGKQSITDARVEVGSYTFHVENGSAYKKGDRIAFFHPCSDEWLTAIDRGGSPTGEWKVDSYPIQFHRCITAVNGNEITVDVPFYSTFDKKLSPSYIYKFDDAPFQHNLGVENFRIDIVTAMGEDEDHAWDAVGFNTVEDCWARNVVALHFGQAGFYTRSACRVTLENCKAIEPVGIVTGSRFYNFNLTNFSQQVLIRDCYANHGRHNFISNGTSSVVGCVFLRCVSEGVIATNEGHRHWSTGMLFDGFREIAPAREIVLAIYNRGRFGTHHGWAAAHCVLWNCDVSEKGKIIVQQPPTAQNYAIGCRGIDSSGNWQFPGKPGYVEGMNRPNLYPVSLYEAQLQARLGHGSGK